MHDSTHLKKRKMKEKIIIFTKNGRKVNNEIISHSERFYLQPAMECWLFYNIPCLKAIKCARTICRSGAAEREPSDRAALTLGTKAEIHSRPKDQSLSSRSPTFRNHPSRIPPPNHTSRRRMRPAPPPCHCFPCSLPSANSSSPHRAAGPSAAAKGRI